MKEDNTSFGQNIGEYDMKERARFFGLQEGVDKKNLKKYPSHSLT